MLKYGSAVLTKRKVKDGRLMEFGGDRSELSDCQEASIQQREKPAKGTADGIYDFTR